MQKFICLILLFAVFISGCSTKPDPAAPNENSDDNSAVEENLPMAELPVDQMQKNALFEPGGMDLEPMPEPLAVLAKNNEFLVFSDAIKKAERASGPIIAIGHNYDIVIKYASSQQRFRYWNGEHLKMITDIEVEKSYFLSDKAVQQIDQLFNVQS